jgi:hypothetical protein
LTTAIKVLRRVTQELALKQSSLLASHAGKKSVSREKYRAAARIEKIDEDDDAFPVNLL